ncbi:MAG: lipoyl(octanoyl) transferase LipB [Anaerolineae bacterium]
MYLLNLGLVAYDDGLELQHRIVEARKSGELDNVLILLEHPPVITLGRQADETNIIAAPEFLDELGIQVRCVERGGDVTYHGPGQLMGYPILNLRNHRKDVGWYIRSLEEVLVGVLADFGIEAEARTGRDTGVWVGKDKIVAIGARIEEWVSYHGFALYVDPIMSHFDLIVPCGLRGKGVIGMRQALDEPVDMDAVRRAVAKHFATVFGVNLEDVTLAELDLAESVSPCSGKVKPMPNESSIDIRKVVVGPWPMNAYVLVDAGSGNSIIIDPGADPDAILAATGGGRVPQILLTHSDPDHIGALSAVAGATGAPVAAHPDAAGPLVDPPDNELHDGDVVKLGPHVIRVIETPGHAPGHVSFLIGDDLIGGDVLFPGGPGHTDTPEDFQQILETVTKKLFELPDEMVVHPGHGEPVTIGQAKAQYARFEAREKPADLCGDVTWESSDQ